MNISRTARMLQGLMIALLLSVSACTVSKDNMRRANLEYNILQKGMDSIYKGAVAALTIQPNDQLSISVTSSTMNQEQVAIFAMANSGGGYIGANSGSNFMIQGGNGQQNPSIGYLVGQDGNIVFPMLGSIRVVGLSRTALADTITDRLSREGFVKKPNVMVRFLQLKVNVLGEVRSPGLHVFTNDRITILDAIASAGDLTINGRRDNIIVIREEKGQRRIIHTNLVNTDFINQDGFQLQQNDVVYVSANNLKLKEVNVNPLFTKDLAIITTLVSLSLVVFNLVLLLNR